MLAAFKAHLITRAALWAVDRVAMSPEATQAMPNCEDGEGGYGQSFVDGSIDFCRLSATLDRVENVLVARQQPRSLV